MTVVAQMTEMAEIGPAVRPLTGSLLNILNYNVTFFRGNVTKLWSAVSRLVTLMSPQ